MQIKNTPLEGLKIIELKIYADERGWFTERYKTALELGNFVQDNHSRSAANVVRGLHYQTNPNQAKLVSCIRGRIYDVAVDIRKNSATFGQHFGIELDHTKMLYIPAGFAHGFAALEESDVMYKVDGAYNPSGEGCIKFDDSALKINWGIANPIVSGKDLQGISPSFDLHDEISRAGIDEDIHEFHKFVGMFGHKPCKVWGSVAGFVIKHV